MVTICLNSVDRYYTAYTLCFYSLAKRALHEPVCHSAGKIGEATVVDNHPVAYGSKKDFLTRAKHPDAFNQR